ncbi:MAG: hypothetical protein K2M70_04015 [Lachnospiraceae bacterium]|nr:hypothetical protein [Lachnospiraceae bacterium]
MLGKLMKYEWKATWKLLLSANLVTVVMSILAWIMVNAVEYSSDFSMVDFVSVMVLFTYVIGMFVVMVGTSIYLIYRFYTSTYGDQGYLLHTLPVDTHHIIIAKVLVSAMWVLINMGVIYLSILLLFAGQEDMLKNMMEGFVNALEYLGAEKVTLFAGIMALIAGLFDLFARVLKVTACISLGQLSPNHKLMLSFVWYFGFYVVQQLFKGLYVLLLFAFQKKRSYADYFSIFENHWEVMLLSGIVYCVVFYVLTWYVMSRKLNLD